ncbi:MAG: L-threonylcarbamoyladenylate synthase [Steroidobacteraceae bacterium]
MVRVMRATQQELNAAVEALRSGDVVAFPTETVYGLGANAQHLSAVQRVFALKGRPAEHPLIVHLDSRRYLHRWARELPASAEKLAAAFWPGPLTLVLPRAEGVLDAVTGGQDTVAVRVPAHPMAQQLLTAFGGGMVAPSANRYGRVSPTRAEHVREEFGDAVPVVLDGGECQIGLESTIVDCTGELPRILRLGMLSASALREVVGELAVGGADAPRVPGSVPAHYAPNTPMRIVPVDEVDAIAEQESAGGRRIAVLAHRPPLRTYPSVTWVNTGRRAEKYAHDLYAHLRTLDKTGCELILVQEVPDTENWAAIRDRLQRAAAGSAQS